MGLVEEILGGNEKSAARLITLVENNDREAYRVLSQLLPHTGKAHVIGVTGPAGAGKSTLVGQLAVSFARRNRNVGVVATDPTSFDGKGAFLGDRIRMKKAEESNIFIRSMAHRSHPGGVARAAAAASSIMEALGKDRIIVESIGAGQSDKDLFFLCDTVITVFTPEYGDEIQLYKAGLMEIGDIIVVNKSDKAGAEDAARDIAIASARRDRPDGWTVPVLLVQAEGGTGVDGLVEAIEGHLALLLQKEERAARKGERARVLMMSLLKEELWRKVSAKIEESPLFDEVSREVSSGRTDPYSAVEQIMEEIEKRWTSR